MNGDIDIDARTDMPDADRNPAEDRSTRQSIPSPVHSHRPPSSTEPNNDDPYSSFQAWPAQFPPPVPPPGGERVFDPLTSSWPGAAGERPAVPPIARPWTERSTYDPLFGRDPFPGDYPGPGDYPSRVAPIPPPPPSEPRLSASPLRHEERPSSGQNSNGRTTGAPAGSVHPAGSAPGFPWSGSAGATHRPTPLYPDESYPSDFNSTDPLGVSAGVADTAFEVPPRPPVSADYPPPPPQPSPSPLQLAPPQLPPPSLAPIPVPEHAPSAHPLPLAAEQAPGSSTAPITTAPAPDPPLYRNGGIADEGKIGAPHPGAVQPPVPYPGGAYPDNPYPSTEYPAPAPEIRPSGHDGAADVIRAPGRLMTSALLPAAPDTASGGWRKLIFRASGGAINPGPSADEARHRRLVAHIRTPLYDCHRVAVMSLKGGVGKTTTTVALGSTLASLRGDRVVAIDANPDRGTLGAKVPRTTTNTVRDLLDNAASLHRYVDVRRYLSQADSRLDVLASANDPEISQAFADTDYLAVDDILQRHYSILLTDCGTGILHSAMPAVLKLADTLVIVSSSSADGGSSASATLDWLDAHGYATQVREAVTVISTFPANSESVDMNTLEQHFAARTRRVVQVPYDPHLAIGGRIMLEELRKATRQAFLEIAGAVAERFGSPLTGGDPERFGGLPHGV
ncbi:MinD/ParA family ATP-binding protein [Frankia sp. Cr2]|uniref:MinD/ParA family ATP-binding protein n=1 Tax=Frankia sp. Cr2 TaxID=3073932 RepID=UPI002AD32CFF|nr:AAA family ATPase [Frankia sp. Cr2]